MFGLEHCSYIKPCLRSTFTCIITVKIYTVHLGLKSRLSDDNKAKCVHVRVNVFVRFADSDYSGSGTVFH